MTGEHARGAWNEFMGSIKQEFGKLTDDDVLETKGDFQKLWGKVQQRYGDVKEGLRDRYDRILNKHYPDQGKKRDVA